MIKRYIAFIDNNEVSVTTVENDFKIETDGDIFDNFGDVIKFANGKNIILNGEPYSLPETSLSHDEQFKELLSFNIPGTYEEKVAAMQEAIKSKTKNAGHLASMKLHGKQMI